MPVIPDRFVSDARPPEVGGMGGFLRRFETHHKTEARPLIWTFGTTDADDDFLTHVWLHNGTEDVLERVTVGNGAFATVDGESCSGSSTAVVYHDVAPGEAVRLDTQHVIYDSDYVIGIEILIERMGKSPITLRTRSGKGGSVGDVLLRDA